MSSRCGTALLDMSLQGSPNLRLSYQPRKGLSAYRLHPGLYLIIILRSPFRSHGMGQHPFYSCPLCILSYPGFRRSIDVPPSHIIKHVTPSTCIPLSPLPPFLANDASPDSPRRPIQSENTVKRCPSGRPCCASDRKLHKLGAWLMARQNSNEAPC